MTSRDALVATAGETIARGSKSFAAASKLFDRRTRERAWLLYAWCRHCDDVMDGQSLGGEMHAVDDPAKRLATIRVGTSRALAGESVGDMPFDAIGTVSRETNLPVSFIEDHLEGFALDAQDWRPRTEQDLLRYCYHVAGAVGCMMAVIMGVDPADEDTLDRASDLGIAFQLANISRDLEEDARAGRCYLPQEWLAELDVPPGEHMRPLYRKRMAAAAGWLLQLVEEYEASARVGAARLPGRSRWAVLSAAGIYGDIAREVVAKGEHAWDARVVTSKADKLGWIARSGAEALIGRGTRKLRKDRHGLWTRPKPNRTASEIIEGEIKTELRRYGLTSDLASDQPIVAQLGMDDEDYATDFIADLEKRYGINLNPLVLTGREIGRVRSPEGRDLTIGELAAFIAMHRA